MPNGKSIDVEIPQRVTTLESEVRMVTKELEATNASIVALSSTVTKGFAELRRDFSDRGRTNWGVVIGAVSAMTGLAAAVGTAWIRPLELRNDYADRRLETNETSDRLQAEKIARLEERLAVYREFGIVGAKP